MRSGRAISAVLTTAAALGLAVTAGLLPWDAGAEVRPGAGRSGGPAETPPAAPPARSSPVATVTAPPTVAASPPMVAPPRLAPLQQTTLEVTYHAQQDPDWCDPADIEMWLQLDGVPLPGSDDYSIQQRLWAYETANNDGYSIAEWNASPYAVAVTLDQFGGWSDIGDAPQPSAAAAGEVISRSVALLHQPVIVMVSGGTHYVLVTGVALGPSVAAPPLAVTVANPLSFGVGGSPPPGSDGTSTMTWADFTAWYTANQAHGGVWSGQWVLISAGIPLVG
jgi:hypothetical protein